MPAERDRRPAERDKRPDGFVNVHLQLDRDLWHRFKRHCYRRDLTLVSAFEQLIDGELEFPRLEEPALAAT